jgi:hypothetical protein
MQREEDTEINEMDTQNMIRYWRDTSNCSVELYTLTVHCPSLESINLPAPVWGTDVRQTRILAALHIKGQAARHFEVGIQETCS